MKNILALFFLVLGLTTPFSVSAFVSDDFNACTLNSGRWQLVDPLGDAILTVSGAGTSDARLQFTVPAGPSHDAWTVNTAPRLLQSVANTDFVIEAKFDSPVSKKYQGQGLLVQQDNNTWLRFDFYSNGAGTRVFAAARTAAGMSVKVDKAITAGAPLYLKVARSLNTWTQSYSYDGSNWVTAVTFTQALSVAAAGPFVGNFGTGSNAPAHTALVDYVFNAASPIVPEDGGAVPGAGALTVTTTGPGRVTVAPEQASYACGTQVQLAAVPDAGSSFTAWGGALSGMANPATLVMNGDRQVSATFIGDTTPPVIGPVSAVVGATSAALSWVTSEPVTWHLDYGPTSTYGQSKILNQPASSYSVTLSDLSPATSYHYRITVIDGVGLSASSGDQVFSTIAQPTDPSGIVSDDFSQGVLHTRWRLHDPLGDASVTLVGTGTGDARLSLSVPAGPSHDPWTLDTAPRLLQAVNNTDFTVDLKFDSTVTKKYQGQGLMVQQDNNTWLRFDFYSDGSKTLIFAASKAGGQMSTKINKGIVQTAGPLYLRVNRSGNLWTEAYSQDGVNWLTAGSFSQSLNVTALGPFAGNFGTAGTAPAHTALVDYVFNAASPIVPEDGSATPILYNLGVSVTGGGQVSLNPPGGSYAPGTQVQLTASADAGRVFSGWTGDLSGATNPATLTMNGSKQVGATFVGQAQPPQISAIQVNPTATDATVSWITDTPASSLADYGETAALGANVSDPSLVVSHSLRLTGLTPGVQYFYRVRSVNAAGETSSAVLTFTTSVPGADPSGIVSDDFNQPNLNSALWTLVNPLNDATLTIEGAGSGNARLLFSVPAGASHDPWTINTAPRLMQVANNTDFGLEVKFESQPQLRYQEQGLFIEQDADNWLRFDVYSDGAATRIFAASRTAGAMSTRISKVIVAGAPLYLRVVRSGSQWTQSYSYNGSTWLTAGSFSQPLSVSAVGPFVGNFGTGNNAPAFTAAIDYFFNLAAPVVPEDGGGAVDTQPPLIQQLQHLVGANSVQVTWLTDEPATGYVEYGHTSGLELGVLGHSQLLTAHDVSIVGLQPETDYFFRVVSADVGGNSGASAIQSLRTAGLGDSTPVINLWYGTEQKFGQNGVPQRFINLLGNVVSSAGFSSLSYSLNGGVQRPLTIGPDGLRLLSQGDFNIELKTSELQLGINSVQLLATDTLGGQIQKMITVDYAPGNQWVQDSVVDWASVSSISSLAQVVDGKWYLDGGYLRTQTQEIGYDRLVALGDFSWQNYEVTVPVIVHSVKRIPGWNPLVGVGVRWQGHTADGKQPSERWFPLGGIGGYGWYYLNRLEIWDTGPYVYETNGLQLVLGTPYVFKFRVETIATGTQYRLKVWQEGLPEPEGWNLVGEEGGSDLKNGSVLLVAHFADVSFGKVKVIQLP